jgi:redox-sensitive bicupin YhaK (pirin superfamily)
MKPAAYRDISAKEIPVVELENKARIKIIAGKFQDTSGPIHGGSTDPYYVDVVLPPRASVEVPLPAGHNAFLYLYDGAASIGEERKPLQNRSAALLSDGNAVRIEAGEEGARVLALAGRPIREPIVQYGPFVMNTREEIEQAIRDYQSGELASKQVARLKIFTPA